jgi:hypothetical protein
MQQRGLDQAARSRFSEEALATPGGNLIAVEIDKSVALLLLGNIGCPYHQPAANCLEMTAESARFHFSEPKK